MADNIINITHDVDGAIEKLHSTKEQIEDLLLEGMEKALLLIESDSKKECPVDEARLRASITHDKESKEDQIVGRVGTNVEYAPYVHQGTGIYSIDGNGRKSPWVWEGESSKFKGKHFTKGQKPHPFIQTAIDKNKDKLGEVFKEIVDGGLK